MKRLISCSLIALMVSFALTAATLAAPLQKTGGAKKPLPTPIFVRTASNELATAIRVRVNGDAVNFTSGEPVEAGDSILVPMRGIFEKLGARVQYDPKTQTIHATRGDTDISLRTGADVAIVNGQSRPLSAPAQIVGETAVVPLRFISETLGARVKWDSGNYIADVNTDALVALKLPTVPGTDAVVGTLTGMFPEASLLTIRKAGGENVRVALTYDVNATRRKSAETGDDTPVSESRPVFGAGALKLGEQVQVERNDDGEGLLVLINTDMRRGVLKSVDALPANGGSQITLTDGSIIALLPDAKVTFGGRSVVLAEIKSGERIAVRLNEKGEGVSLIVVTASQPNEVPALLPAVVKPANDPAPTKPTSLPAPSPQ